MVELEGLELGEPEPVVVSRDPVVEEDESERRLGCLEQGCVVGSLECDHACIWGQRSGVLLKKQQVRCARGDERVYP